jgi:hypothetical protein
MACRAQKLTFTFSHRTAQTLNPIERLWKWMKYTCHDPGCSLTTAFLEKGRKKRHCYKEGWQTVLLTAREIPSFTTPCPQLMSKPSLNPDRHR